MKSTIAKLLFVIPMMLSTLLNSLYAQAQAVEREFEDVAIYVGGMMKSRSGAT
ncbi:MAG: hypothetical protein IIC60_11570 [Proteobacteria bacterium]|nr:hypothetical protein [Pseudomonadota bacterium]